MTLQLDKKFVFSLNKHPQIYFLLSKLTLLTYRSILWEQNFCYLDLFAMIVILIEFLHLLLMKKIQRILKKLYFLSTFYTIFAHLLHIYFAPSGNLEFFLGMEAMLIVYINFKEIKNKFLRFAILGLLSYAFFKKFTDFNIRLAEFIYFSSSFILFEHAMRNESERNYDRTIEIVSNRSNTSYEKKKSCIFEHEKSFKLKPQKTMEFVDDQHSKTLNLINRAFVVINQDFNLTFANTYSVNFFQTKILEEMKELFLLLQENTTLNKTYSYKFPEFELNQIFEKTFHQSESADSSRMDEATEKYEFNRILIDRIQEKNDRSPVKDENKRYELNFKKWNKRILKENLTDSIRDHGKKNSHPETVSNFLKKVFNHLRYETCAMKDSRSSNRIIENESTVNRDWEKNYSMYVNYKSKKGEEFILFLNVYPIFDASLKEEIRTPNELLISIRVLNEIEAKYMDDLSSKNKMLGSFCHELRTPIHGIINMLDMMQTQFHELDATNEIIRELEDLCANSLISSHLLLNQIDDFIDYFSFANDIIELHIKGFDFNSFLNDIFRVFSRVAIKKKLTFSIDIDENIPAVIYNDDQKLRRIIFNLINNSLRFTDSGGIIKIRAKLRKRNFIGISVYDTGYGIKPEELHSIGRINNNVNDLHKNTCGFGLFISNILCLLVERNEPDRKKGLTVYSEVGVGTCFSFSFRFDLSSENSYNDPEKTLFRFSNSFEKKETKVYSISSSELFGDKCSSLSNEKKLFILTNKVSESKRDSLTASKSLTNSFKPMANSLGRKRNLTYLQTDSIKCEDIPSAKIYSLTNSLESSLFFLNECNCVKVLIVDDVPFNIEACSRLLAKMKISCDSANNGLEAVEKIALLLSKTASGCSEVISNEQIPSDNYKEKNFCVKCKFYKLILMDIDMPIKNGIEATEEILNLLKKYDISVNIVGLSAFDQEDIVKRSMEAGMKEFITKPIKHNKLKEIISKYLSN